MKKTVLPVLFAAVLLLSGCSLIVKDPLVDARQVIVDVNGNTMDKQSFSVIYNNALNNEYYMQQLYQQYGLVSSINVDREQVLEDALENTVRHMVLLQKAEEFGLDELTETERKSVEEKTDSIYKDNLEQIQTQFFEETILEGKELEDAVEGKVSSLGITRLAIEFQVREEKLLEKLELHATEEITVSDEEVKLEFDTRVEDARARYESDRNAYGSDVNAGKTVYYAPTGYRLVKQVLVKFLPEDREAMDELNEQLNTVTGEMDSVSSKIIENDVALSGEDLPEEERKALEHTAQDLTSQLNQTRTRMEEISGQLAETEEEAYERIYPGVRDVLDRVAQGEAFDVLVAEYSEDTGMPDRGYAVTEGFTDFDEAFVAPAMALQSPGDISEPSRGIYGFYIVYFSEEVPEGPVSLVEVNEEIRAELLVAKKEEAYRTMGDAWVGEASVKTYSDRMD